MNLGMDHDIFLSDKQKHWDIHCLLCIQVGNLVVNLCNLAGKNMMENFQYFGIVNKDHMVMEHMD